MKQKFPWLQSKSSGSFFLVMMSSVMQGQFYKVRSQEFWHQLISNSMVTTCILLFVVVVIHPLVCPNPLSAEKLEKFAKSQDVGLTYSGLPGMFLGLILVSSCFQYIMHRQETQLNFWNFVLSSAVAISIGFLMRWVSSYFVNRHLKASKQLNSISQFSP